MALQPPPFTPTRLPLSSSPTPTTPLEISQQLQRVEVLHQQVKAEAQRAQEFLIKLRRGELEAQTQAQLQLEQRQRDREESDRRSKGSENKDGMCTCSCPHHGPPPPPPPPPPPTSSGLQTAAQNRNSFSANSGFSMPPLNLPTRVDEKEVRDLEKRVRGLEGRVRGFEGLPPDREMALMEVERLRRELEGLARRREGLFEGLGCEETLKFGSAEGKNGTKGTVNGSPNSGGIKSMGVPAAGVQKTDGRVSANGAKGSGKGGKKG